MTLTNIALTDLREPQQIARAVIDEDGINELAADLKRVGVLQPLHVKAIPGGYEVVDGHRRLLAARRAALVTVPCLVIGDGDASDLAIKIHANLYRQDWTPVEEAAFYAELLPICANDNDMLAQMVHETRGYVESRLALLLGDPEVLEAVVARQITLGVSQELNKIKHDADRKYYLGWAIQQGATIATVRQWRAISDAQALAPQVQPRAEGEAGPTVQVRGRELVCFLCGKAEPLSDVEFWYIHRFCQTQLKADVERRSDGDK